MKLKELLKDKQPVILKRWLDLVFDDYPQDSRRFLSTQKDRFANPVGFVIQRGLEGLLECLLQEREPGIISPSVRDLVRLRAVQDFSPSKALSFVPCLKRVLRELFPDICDQQFIALEMEIDRILMEAFDIYMRCRERIYQIRIEEVKRRMSGVPQSSRPLKQ